MSFFFPLTTGPFLRFPIASCTSQCKHPRKAGHTGECARNFSPVKPGYSYWGLLRLCRWSRPPEWIRTFFTEVGRVKNRKLSSRDYCIRAYILWHTVFIRLTALGAYQISLDLESGRLFEAGRLFE